MFLKAKLLYILYQIFQNKEMSSRQLPLQNIRCYPSLAVTNIQALDTDKADPISCLVIRSHHSVRSAVKCRRNFSHLS